MSSINPNNIDGQYPIAGQDNDSQGFRDNFTNIKNNFTFAYNELTDLQSKAVLKSALSGGSLNNDMAYAQLISPQLLKSVETVNNLGTKTGSFTISWADGHFQYYTTSGNTTLAFSNWPTSAYYTKLRLQITTDTTNRTVTFPAAVSVGLSDIQGAAGQVVTLPTAGVYLFELTTLDNGTTITIQDLLRNYDIVTTGSSGTFTSLNVSGNVLASSAVLSGLGVNGNTSIGKAGAVSGQFHSVIGNITQTSSGGAVYINTTGNVLAAGVVAGAVTSTGFINTSGNVSGAVVNAGSVNASGNVLAAGAVFNTATINGNVAISGNLNIAGNINILTVDQASFLYGTLVAYGSSYLYGDVNTEGNLVIAGGRNDTGYQIYKPTANVDIQANVDVSRVIVAATPSGGISDFYVAVTLPNVATDGKLISITSNTAVASFRVLSPWVGYAVDSGANTALTAGSTVNYLFHSADNKWFKV